MTPNKFNVLIPDMGGYHQLDPQGDMSALESLRISQLIVTCRDLRAAQLIETSDIIDFMREHRLERHFKWLPADIQRNSWL